MSTTVMDQTRAMATQVRTWVIACRYLAASERTRASSPAAAASIRRGDPAADPAGQAGEQHRGQDQQHDLQAAAAQPGCDVGEWSDRGTPFTAS
jgi:hypothetical protein